MPLYRYAVRPTFIGAVLNGRRYPSTIGPVLERRSSSGGSSRCPRRCSLIRRPTSTRSGSASTAPKDIPVVVNMGPVDEEDVPAKVAGYDTVHQRRDLFQRADAGEVHGPEAHRLPRHRRGELRRHRRRPEARHQGLDHHRATATPPWPSTRWAWCSPPPATSPPCTASCAAAAGGRCRAWNCAARRWASSAWAASAREMARLANGIGLEGAGLQPHRQAGHGAARRSAGTSRTSSACTSA